MNRLLAVALVLVVLPGCGGDKAAALLSQGDQAMEVKDYDLALSCFDDYVKARPAEAAGYIRRGRVYRERGQLDKSIADYTEAIKLDPGSRLAYSGRSLAYFKAERFDEAKRDSDKADALARASN
ncbi:MAG: tetratricopeptide repeat protein [Planctomycetia bacterium]|nr:tetratricopeptide repeat protein [Planctomycetia bacterium]